MSDNQKNLEIKISTLAETGGAKEAATEVEKTTEAAKKATQATEEHKEKVHFLGLETGELRKLTRELGEQFPIAAEAARFFLNPLVAGITTAIALFSKASEALAEWNKELDEAGAKAAEHDFAEGIEAKAASLATARQAMADYRYELEHTITQQQKFMTALSDTNVLLEAQFQADKKVRDAKLAAAEDRINRSNLSPEAKAIQIDALHKNAGAADDKAEFKKENDEIANTAKAALELREKQKGLDEAAAAAQKKAGDAESDRRQMEVDSKVQLARLPYLEAERQKALDKYDAQRKRANNYPPEDQGAEAIKQRELADKYGDEFAEKDREYQKPKDTAKNLLEKSREVNNDQAESKTAGDAALKNKTDREALDHELALKVQLANIHDQGVADANKATGRSGNAVSQIDLAAKAEHAREIGGHATQAQNAALDEVIKIITALHGNVADGRRDLNTLATAVLNDKGKDATTKRILGMLGQG